MFSNRKDILGLEISLYCSFIVNKDTILFFDRGSNSIASKCLWYYVISKDLTVMVDEYNALNWYNNELELTDEMKLYAHYGTFMDWNPDKQCLISYFDNYYSETDTSRLLMEVYPFGELRKNILPYKCPACYKREEYCIYAYHNLFYPIFAKNKYFVAFGVTPEIYEIEKDSLKIYALKHKNFSEPKKYCVSDTIRGTIGDDFIRAVETSFAYLYFLYDKYNDKYYRIYEAEMPDKNKDGFKNIYPDDKTLAVNVISADFSKCKETIVKNKSAMPFTFSERSHYVLPHGIVNIVFDYKTGKLVQTVLKIDLSNYEK